MLVPGRATALLAHRQTNKSATKIRRPIPESDGEETELSLRREAIGIGKIVHTSASVKFLRAHGKRATGGSKKRWELGPRPRGAP